MLPFEVSAHAPQGADAGPSMAKMSVVQSKMMVVLCTMERKKIVNVSERAWSDEKV